MTMLEQTFRRDRLVVSAAVGAIAVTAWFYLIWLTSSYGMSGMAMPDMMDMPDMIMDPGIMPWSVGDFIFMFVMWTVMMVGMMLPSTSPMVLIYARVARQAHERQKPFAATGWFVGGYLLSWAGFSLLATSAQCALEQAAVLTPMTLVVDQKIGAIVLIAAGLYQWSPFKNACLTQCQAPLSFIQRHGGFRNEPLGSLTLGFRHGLYCIGCCWMLMALLFVVGVMNLFWIGAIAIFVLLEKLNPVGDMLPKAAGFLLVGTGVWMLFR